MNNKTYKYIYMDNIEMMVEASVTEAVAVDWSTRWENSNEPCDAECHIESVTVNGAEIDIDGYGQRCGKDIFDKDIWRELHTVICDAILEGECDYV